MITSRQAKELRIDLEDFAGNKVYAKYSTFRVGSETEEYKLTVSGYIGDAGMIKSCTPQPLYNTIVGVQSINRVSYTYVLYPNKNV